MKFFYFFFLGKICQKNVFGNVLDRKLAFLDYKNMHLKKSQNWHFAFLQRGWSMVFAKIMKSVYFFFLGKTRQKKVIGYVLYRKLAFLDYKNNDLKN